MPPTTPAINQVKTKVKPPLRDMPPTTDTPPPLTCHRPPADAVMHGGGGAAKYLGLWGQISSCYIFTDTNKPPSKTAKCEFRACIELLFYTCFKQLVKSPDRNASKDRQRRTVNMSQIYSTCFRFGEIGKFSKNIKNITCN